MRLCRSIRNLLCTVVLTAASASATADEIAIEQPPGGGHRVAQVMQPQRTHQVAGARIRHTIRATTSYATYPSSSADLLLTAVVITMLVAYQLRRKHRFLRPHPFSL